MPSHGEGQVPRHRPYLDLHLREPFLVHVRLIAMHMPHPIQLVRRRQ